MNKAFQLIIGNRIDAWITFFSDREQLFVFTTLFLFFPSPFFYVVLAGLAPTASLLFIGYLAKPDMGSLVIYLIVFFVIFLNFLVNCYLLRWLVRLVMKIFRKLIKHSSARKVTLTLILLLFVAFSFTFDVYSIGDAGGRSNGYSILALYKSFLSI